jgi:hypothetical protein
MCNMGYTPEEAEQAITDGKLDAVAFGTPFLANPDLPARIKAGAALNAPDASTFYTPGAKGYTDYPTLSFHFQNAAAGARWCTPWPARFHSPARAVVSHAIERSAAG